MAAMASSPAAASLTSFRPEISARKLRYSVSGISLSPKLNRQPRSLSLRVRIRAVQRDETFVEERESELLTKLNGNGSLSKKFSNGSVSNGSVISVIESEKTTNGSLVKYASGNGVATSTAKVAERKEEAVGGKGKKTIEEIGQEDAWFKRTAGPNVEVRSYTFRSPVS